MGWCSATEIMDAAIRAALDMLDSHTHPDGPFPQGPIPVEFQHRLSPFVQKIAKELRDGDWDCIDESVFFHDFPQEMLGHDDREFAAWKQIQLSGWDGTPADWPRWAGPVPAVVCARGSDR